jgi:hypothetical protein
MQRGTTFKQLDAPAAGVEKASQFGKDERLVSDRAHCSSAHPCFDQTDQRHRQLQRRL